MRRTVFLYKYNHVCYRFFRFDQPVIISHTGTTLDGSHENAHESQSKSAVYEKPLNSSCVACDNTVEKISL